MKALKGVTLASVCISVLYIALAAVLPFSAFSFRTWADTLGQVIAALVTPLLLVALVLTHLWKSRHLTESPKAIITLLTIIGCMAGAFFVCLLIAFGRESETTLTKNLIVIGNPYPAIDSHFAYYRPEGLFLKKTTQITNADRADYLCEKYGLEFIADEESGRIYESGHPQITVTVNQHGLSLTDDYMDELTFHCLKEGYEILGLKREYVLHEKGKGWSDNSFCLIGKNLGDLSALSKDIFLLANYCIEANGGDSEENVYHRYPGHIEYGFSYNGEAPLSLFKYSFQYGQLEPDAIKEQTLADYHSALAEQRKEQERKAAMQNQVSENIPETDGEIAGSAEAEETYEPDYREKPAKMIYETFLAKEGFSYEVCFNAKGNLYIDLGSKEEDGQTYHYRLVYDRPSKNGLCELFVLYRAREGSNDEAIVDMYAAEPDTGEVVRSGRKAWSDVGTKAYRDLTGE